MLFNDRIDAGRRLAARLEYLRDRPLVVLGLPRGGVPVAAEVAEALDAALDVLVIRKLGAPGNKEYAMGAIGEGGVRVIDEAAMRAARVSPADLEPVEREEREELARRSERFRRGRPPVRLTGRTALIVDDGVATGSTARAACLVARALGAAEVVLAVPVAPPEWTHRLAGSADALVALATPPAFFAVGQWYSDFSQTSDDEVISCLDRAGGRG